MKNAALEKWTPFAIEVQEPLEKLPVPVYVLSGEAVDLARFVQRHYSAQRDAAGKVVRPGLELAAAKGKVTPELASEILELQEAFGAANTQYLLAISREPESPMRRAEFVLGELVSTLTYLLDDGEDDDDDARLAVLNEEHRSALSQDARAAALDDYAALAEQHRAKLDGLGGFDVGQIEEARQLARSLREQSASKLAGQPAPEQKSALELRNRIATLLCERMNLARSAARFVFRNDPELIRKVTSNYERQRRAKARRARQESDEAGVPTEAGSADAGQ